MPAADLSGTKIRETEAIVEKKRKKTLEKSTNRSFMNKWLVTVLSSKARPRQSSHLSFTTIPLPLTHPTYPSVPSINQSLSFISVQFFESVSPLAHSAY